MAWRCLAYVLVAAAVLGAFHHPRMRMAPVRVEQRRNEKDGSVLLLIPAGSFTMGSREYRDARPPFRLHLDACWIGKQEVTNAQFDAFVRATGYRAEGKWRRYFEPGRERHPVVSVSWYDAVAYCRWAGGRLPTEAEWEKAARGTDARLYPWGDEWDADRCNNRLLGRCPPGMARIHQGRGTLPVGSLPQGDSPYGVEDMAGNAHEWTGSTFLPYPYRPDDGREGNPQPLEVALRGGGWAYDHVGFFRADTRSRCKPAVFGFFIGFRLAVDEPRR